MKKYECIICNYSTNRKYNLNIHYKSKKHKNKNEKFICKCGKSYKYKSGLCKHKKKCVISKQIKTIENQIFELKNENKFIKKKANILTNELIKSNKTNTDIINEVKKIIEDNFNLSPRGIREMLKLNNPIYEITSAYGHFGRKPTSKGEFTWENTDKIDLFKL